MQQRTNEWYRGVREVGSDDDDAETALIESTVVHGGIDRGARERKNASSSDSTESLLSGNSRTTLSAAAALPAHQPL